MKGAALLGGQLLQARPRRRAAASTKAASWCADERHDQHERQDEDEDEQHEDEERRAEPARGRAAAAGRRAGRADRRARSPATKGRRMSRRTKSASTDGDEARDPEADLPLDASSAPRHAANRSAAQPAMCRSQPAR